ncbi:MAG TPA: Grx4 family monothiol glutaredoxin [Polyangiaceae bacterium]|jgi:monothiol glutaredoxin
MLSDTTRTQIEDLVQKNHVVLFMKGSRHFPQCGFSATVTRILDSYLPKYETVNVLSSPDIRDGIKEYSSWPTIPQLYIGGKFVGGCDIVKELDASGELAKLLGSDKQAPAKAEAPQIELSADAKAAIVAAQKEAGGDPLRIAIGPRHEYDLYFDAKQPGDVHVEASGLPFVLDAESAARAGKLAIAFVEGQGFRLDSSKAPPRVKSMSASELKKLLDSNRSGVYLVDVRPEAERKLASIPGYKALEPETIDALGALPAETPIVVYCKSGGRSRAAAEQLLSRGLKNIFNLEGGVTAYAEVDPTIPRY